MEPRTKTSAAGQYAGVAVVSKQPSRALCSAWPNDMYATGRVQIVGSLIGQQWVTGAVVYGYPQSKLHANAAEKTAGILAHVFEHMTKFAQGPRYMAGDWNFSQDQLAVTQQLLDAGWQEVQTLEYMRSGRQPCCTSKGKTQIDHLWISPELAVAFQQLEIDNDMFPDHVVLKATFAAASNQYVRYLWPTPQPVPWNHVPDLASQVDFMHDAPSAQYAHLWHTRESIAQVVLKHEWQPNMQGRGQRTSTATRHGWPAPPKQGRSQDPQPTFMGYDVQHTRWLRQLRRLTNYHQWAKCHWQTASAQAWTHGLLLWRSILRAPGFGLSFSHWWHGRSVVGLDDPGCIPLYPPMPEVAMQLCECFQCEVRAFERRLHQARVSTKKQAHVQNPNLIFRDTRRPAPEPVSTLLVKSNSVVVEVDDTDVAVVIDPPCQFDDSRPVVIDTVPVQVIHATDTKLYLDSVHEAMVGTTVTQSQPIGALDAVFEAFHEQWRKRWCKHDSVPSSHWKSLVDFARATMPQWQLPALEITPALLQAEVAHKKPTAATGMDGVSRRDLLAASPNMMASFCNMFERASTDGAWPLQVVTGKVASLAKKPQPQGTGDYRPITVFSLLYRCYSSLQARHLLAKADEWCHPDIHGNRKSHQTAHLWRTLVDQIQCAYDQAQSLSGLTADIEKAFNCLPRYPVLAMALHVGTSMDVMTAWTGALASMVRRFKVRDSFSMGFTTSTGLAEGCAMSCYGMLLLDDVMHRYVQAQCPHIRVLSFVDNWDFLTWDPNSAVRQMDVLQSFAALADLTVDVAKTFGWSTSPVVRGYFRRVGIPVKHHAKDLGAHVAFSRQRTNQTLAQRLDSLEPLWGQLRSSRASYAGKLRALRSVAWPRGLFGVASAPLGSAVWLKHRRLAVKGLGFDKPGVNPGVLLGLVEAQADPEWLGILATVAEARQFCSLDFWALDFYHAASGDLAPPPSSPCAVLLSRVQQLGLHVMADGRWMDVVGCFHPGQLNFTELSLRLQWCWNRIVAASVAHRKDFGGLVHVDVVTTRRCLAQLPVDQQALMRLSLSGGLYTQDAHAHWNDGPGTCKWCGQMDSLDHRYFHCPATSQIRQRVAPDLSRLRQSVPDALALRSWAVLPPTQLDWLQCLNALPSQVPRSAVSLSSSQWNCIFTDGSCLWQSSPEFRVAAWGVVLAVPFSGQWTSTGPRVLCSGPLPGLCQTAFRAELYALCVALHHASVGGFREKIFSDCLSVINKFYLLTRGQVQLKQNTGNADLWMWLLFSLDRLGRDNVQLIKTPAHRRVSSATTQWEAWQFWHNSVVDRVAKCANQDRGDEFWRIWTEHATAVTAAKQLHDQAWQLHLQVGLMSVQADSKVDLDAERVTAPRATRVFEPQFCIAAWKGTIPPAFANEYGHGMATRVARWWTARTSAGTEEIRWISFVHLFVDYQLSWGCAGPLQNKKTWLDACLRPYLDAGKFPFLKRLKWFRRCLKQFWSQSHQVIGMEQCRCHSEVIQTHIQSASVRWDAAALCIAEAWIADNCRGPVARGTKALQSLPVANAIPGLRVSDNASNDADVGVDYA